MLFLPMIVSVFSLFFVRFLIKEINKAPVGSGKMIEISQAVKQGAMTFLKRQRRACFLAAAVIFLILWIFLGFKIAAGFLVGVAVSALAGYLGMIISTKANVKVAEAAESGLAPALALTFKGGSATGFLVVGLALLSVAVFYWATQDLKSLIALCLGASLIAIFTRLDRGIYAKDADVGDCDEMAGDMFQTYVIALTAAMLLANLIFPNLPPAIFLPLHLSSLTILASIIATFFVRLSKNQNIMPAFYQGLMIAGILSVIGFFPVVSSFARALNFSIINLYLPALVGLIIPVFAFIIAEFVTSKKHSPVQSIVEIFQSGHSANLINGLAAGMKSTILPVFLISIAILISFWSGGIYGLAIALVSMLSLTGLIIAIDTYRPITKTITKGYAIVSAGLAALVLFFAYTQELINLGARIQFLLEEPKVLVGLFIGGMAVYYFAALAMTAAGKTAGSMVWPALLPVILPVLTGFLLGPQALAGLLIGSIIVGIFLAISMDYIIPGINPMIKTLNIVALLIISFLV